ncbi:hypothetical protein DN069_29250 [Streptacidiphilus pinicola]|uniref:HTH luxR-type domain-containing protein n=1 Tax=Streptacidiphilus pinicola TaxID=2219663 RepID=A0A2X0K3K2_9ACTN|nr:hypothetical protein [Streptacidiphilus pinicola]RAG82129.1 hypothetical protein DN069_29250 [Streptacidiphilus pinicola]
MSGGERRLSQAAEAYYKRVCTDGARLAPADVPDHERPLVDELVRLSLLEPDTEAGGLVAVDPRLAKIELGAPYYEDALLKLSAARQLPAVVARLSREFHRSVPPGGTTSGVSEIATGRAEVARRLAALTDGCAEELLDLRQRMPDDGGQDVFRRTLANRGPGFRWRTVLRTAARFLPAHRAHAAAVVEAGGEVRTEDHLIEPLLVFDRTTAVIPADLERDPTGRETVALITDPAAVDYLRGVFLTIWEDAHPFVPDADSADATERLKRSILHLLGEGLDQAAIGRELGLAPRTLNKYIALLKSDFDVASLFQLGAAVTRGHW